MPHFGSFDLISHFSFSSHFWKVLWSNSRTKRVWLFSFNLLLQSFLHSRPMSFFFFFSSLLLFCKMLEATLLGMHASAYFIFGIFISIYFLPWFMPCYLRKMHIIFFVFGIWVSEYASALSAMHLMVRVPVGSTHLIEQNYKIAMVTLFS